MTSNARDIWDLVDAKKEQFAELSDRVWDTPELLYAEVKSAAAHREMLEREGFRVTDRLAGIGTAMMGEAGEGGPVIAILGEFDALPGLSQKAGIDRQEPLEAGGNGHGCGHNLLGAGALLAATAVKDYLEKNGIAGRVRYYGCPAEEGGAAKTFMVRDGVFDDVDIALSWHPTHFSGIIPPLTLAVTMIDFHFAGRAAHAAVAPHLGRSALDAVELMSVGVNYLREHVPSDSRIHYAVLDSGGRAPNVVQAKATVRYSVRALKRADMEALLERVRKVAEGAALMTGTSVTSQVVTAMSEILDNPPLYKLVHDNFVAVGPAPFDAEDRAFAARMQATMTPDDIDSAFLAAGVEKSDTPICDQIVPLEARGVPMLGSTDLGDVSWVVPMAQLGSATYAIGTPGHSWQVTAQGKTPAAHKGMVQVAKALAGSAVDLLGDPALVAAAKADLKRRTAAHPYSSPLPADLKPQVPA
jgi:aminobenzoyl-glutamate utilization protein B